MKNVLTLEAFADWVESKPPLEVYNWMDADRCACGQYAKYLGIDGWSGSLFYSQSDEEKFWEKANHIAQFDAEFRTFGRLAKELRHAIALQAA